MVDKVAKAVQKFTSKEKQTVKGILGKIENWDFQGLNVKKLEGREDVFRVRKGRIRIIYRLNQNREIFILAIERRSEKTYRNF